MMKQASLCVLLVVLAFGYVHANEVLRAQPPAVSPRDLQAHAPNIVLSSVAKAPTKMPPNGAAVNGIFINGEPVPVNGVEPVPAPADNRDPDCLRQPGVAGVAGGKGKGGKGKGGRRDLRRNHHRGRRQLGKGGSSRSGRGTYGQAGVLCDNRLPGVGVAGGKGGKAGSRGSSFGQPRLSNQTASNETEQLELESSLLESNGEDAHSSAVYRMAPAAIAAAGAALFMVM